MYFAEESMEKQISPIRSSWQWRKLLVVFWIFFVVSMMTILAVYAANQGKSSYRSIHWSSTVGYENNPGSFNNNMVEEHNMCFAVTNACTNDVFIPTKTTGEMLSFSWNHPGCTTLTPCNRWCVLKTFLNGVQDGSIQYSKFRNDLNGFINNQWTGTTGYWNFVLWYGQSLSISLVYDNYFFPGRPRIASSPKIADFYDTNYSVVGEIHEFELYGISPETENINRWCFDDGSYRVNSNVYSRQVLFINSESSKNYQPDRQTTRFNGFTWANFWLKLNINPLGDMPSYRYNRFFGCRSDLLPNPDKYCVERVIPKDGTVPDNQPSAIYIKEFTNNYLFSGCWIWWDICYNQRVNICLNTTWIANNASFRILSTGDIWGTGWFYNMIRPYGGAGTIWWSSSNEYFYYRNTTWTNPWANYSTQIFWFYAYSGWTYTYHILNDMNSLNHLKYLYDNNYFYYSSNEIWKNGDPHLVLTHQNDLWYNTMSDTGVDSFIKIPLQEFDTYLIYEDTNLNGNYDVSYIWSSWDMQTTQQLSKYICVSHTCKYARYSTGCWPCVGPLCNSNTIDPPAN